MAESNHDDLADALARLAGGEVAPSEREHEPAPPPPPPPVPPPPKPPAAKPAFRPATQAPAPPRPQVPREAVPARPAGPVVPPAPVIAPALVARPQRPAVPTIRPMAPAPLNLAPPEDFTPDATDPDAVIDDDDIVIVPAPDASVFIPKKKPTTTAEARARVAHQKQLDFRRTLIPILLTTGVLTIAFGIAPKAMGPDSIAATLPHWVTPTLVATGLVLLALAILNMVSVRSMLLADARAAAPASR